MTNLGIILIYTTLFVLYTISIGCLFQLLCSVEDSILQRIAVLVFSCVLGPIFIGFIIGKLLGVFIERYI